MQSNVLVQGCGTLTRLKTFKPVDTRSWVNSARRRLRLRTFLARNSSKRLCTRKYAIQVSTLVMETRTSCFGGGEGEMAGGKEGKGLNWV